MTIPLSSPTLVARLRARRRPNTYQVNEEPDALCQEAANEIERLSSPPNVERVARAIADPGSFVGFRRPDETVSKWQARAVFAALSSTQDTASQDCERCQGNGEIVTDWDRHLNSREGDKGDEAVAECPDCEGTGKLDTGDTASQDSEVDLDALALQLMYELHRHVPEAERPMSLSDLSDEQLDRARKAVNAILVQFMLSKPAGRFANIREALSSTQDTASQDSAIEQVAQDYEAEGNNLAAWTLRNVGPAGSVLEQQVQAKSQDTGDIRAATIEELASWKRDHQREALRANRAEDRFIRAEERIAELEALLAPFGRLPILLQRYNAFRKARALNQPGSER